MDARSENTLVLTLSIDRLEIIHKVSLIKIDAEGHEPFVFNGAKKLIERDKPRLIIENVTADIREQLTQWGYTERKYEDSPNSVF
jgi:hypothetical protein